MSDFDKALSRWVNSGRQPVIPKQLPESTSATIPGFWDEGGRITAKMELFAEAMLLAMLGLHASLDLLKAVTDGGDLDHATIRSAERSLREIELLRAALKPYEGIIDMWLRYKAKFESLRLTACEVFEENIDDIELARLKLALEGE